MNHLQYSTDEVLNGPWLLDVKALKELDSIILKHWTILEERRQRFLDLAVDDEYKKYENQLDLYPHEYLNDVLEAFRRSHPVYSVKYLQFRIQYRKSTFFCESFESAFHARQLDDMASEGVAIEFCSGDVNGRIELNKSNGLWISISPEETQEVQDFYRDIYHWAVDHRARYWQRLWGNIADFGYRPYIGIVFILGIVLGFINLTQNNIDIQNAQIAAARLLDQGITSSNLPEAVNLLLQMQVLGKQTIEIPSWFRIVLLGTIFLAIVIPIRPKVVIGIGKGIGSIRYWKLWQIFVGITIPSLVLSNFILPFIVNLIKQIVNMP